MTTTSSTRLDFKFHYIQNGNHAHFLAKKGFASSEALHLGEDRLRYGDILDSTTRDNRLVLVLDPENRYSPTVTQHLIEGQSLVLEVKKVGALELERFIDRYASVEEVKRHRRQLEAEGKGDLFRSSICPVCQATIDLSELEETPYIYCRYCETVYSEEKGVITAGGTYRHCDECGLFDRVRGYTEFYFYFLLIAYGFSYKRRHLCDNCCASLFWKVFLINFIFVLGVPPAIWLKLKSMTGRDPKFKRLAQANRLARKGRVHEAASVFDELYRWAPDHPGIRLNEAIGYLQIGDVDRAGQTLESSLASCSNYAPTLQFVHEIQQG